MGNQASHPGANSSVSTETAFGIYKEQANKLDEKYEKLLEKYEKVIKEQTAQNTELRVKIEALEQQLSYSYRENR